jgi:hypothetical protein
MADLLFSKNAYKLNLYALVGGVQHFVVVIIRWVMMFNATFNNISVISWRSVLLVEET